MAANYPFTNATEHIRSLELSSDLNKVADLVETCFPIDQDPDGQTYIREMRKAAREYRHLGWIAQMEDVSTRKPAGFVWVESNQIIGNLSLIPFKFGGKTITLLANVAVDQKHRRKGIARALTIRALEQLRKHGESEVWLQVRQDNPPAIDLYRSVGFVNRAVRTTWRIHPNQLKGNADVNPHQLILRRRQHENWEKQLHWLAIAYPKEIRWNLSINLQRFQPGVFQALNNYLDGVYLRQWELTENERTMGWITWQKTNTYANNLWLAFREDLEPGLLPGVLSLVFKRLNRRHPISVDYPFGRFQDGFTELGFSHFRTLIWMKLSLN